MTKIKKEADNVLEDNYGAETEQGYEGVDDFNVEEDFQPTPLIAEGYYNAAVTDVKFDSTAKAIVWSFTFNNNGGVMSDGETPIDGATLDHRNWLPRPGDDVERTKSGRQTKRQAKINMLHDFAEAMNINITTPRQILESIANSDWIGLEAQVKVEIRTWEGRPLNGIAKVVAA